MPAMTFNNKRKSCVVIRYVYISTMCGMYKFLSNLSLYHCKVY